jgi:hypothetical protein
MVFQIFSVFGPDKEVLGFERIFHWRDAKSNTFLLCNIILKTED